MSLFQTMEKNTKTQKHFLGMFFVAFCTLLSCQQHNYKTFTVKGVAKNLRSKKISLLGLNASFQPTILDTTTVDEKGNFSLKTLSQKEGLYVVRTNDSIDYWLVNDANEIGLKIDAKSYTSYSIANSVYSNELKAFISKADSLIKQYNDQRNTVDSVEILVKKDSLIESNQQLLYQSKKVIESFFAEKIEQENSSSSLKFFYLFYAHKTNVMSQSLVKQGLVKATKLFPSNEYFKSLKTAIDSFEKHNPSFFLAQTQLPSFKYINTDSEKIDNKKYIGKYLLVSLWSTKNLESIKANQKLKQIYSDYNSKNLDILSINLDSSTNAFNKYFKKDSLPWSNVRDTLYFKSKFIKSLQISRIPSIILSNPKGIIVDIGLSDLNLSQKLKFYLN
jgi:hypothetical protein